MVERRNNWFVVTADDESALLADFSGAVVAGLKYCRTEGARRVNGIARRSCGGERG